MKITIVLTQLRGFPVGGFFVVGFFDWLVGFFKNWRLNTFRILLCLH